MALSTWTGLKESALNALLRTGDADASTRFPDWILKFEAHARRELAGSNLGELVADNATISDEYTTLPSNLISVRSAAIVVNSLRRNLQSMTPTSMDNAYSSSTGVPEAYAIVGNSIRLGPPPNASYTVRLLYTALPALNEAASTNWLLTNAPDVYENGVLAYAKAYYEDMAGFQTLFDAANGGIASLVKQAKRNLPASGLAPRVIGGIA